MSKTQAIQKLLHKSGLCIRKYSPVALSCVASVGVVVTAIAAAKATPRAVALVYANSRKNHDGDPYAYTKKEAFIAAWKCYIPAVAFGASTIVCIMGANALNRRQQAALTSAYALVQNSYKEYKDKLKELYGEEAHNAIMDSIIKEKCKEVSISANGGWYGSSLDFGDGMEPEITRTFYDSFSQRYFESTIEKVIQAEYHLNRNFMFAGVIPLNDFYEFLGLEKTELGDAVGWSSCNGDIYWIDFNHHRLTLDDGMEIYVIDMVLNRQPSGWKTCKFAKNTFHFMKTKRRFRFMNNAKLIKILGLVATAVGMGATLLTDWVNEKKMEEKIDERIDEKLAALSDEEDEES